MPRFFVSQDAIRGNQVRLDDRLISHLKALRLRTGEELTVSDGQGTDYRCIFRGLEDGAAFAEICFSEPCLAEPALQAALFTAMPKGDKPELILQKAVELGAAEVFFFLSSRCVSRPDEKAALKRLERLRRISEEAAMQSGRGRIPQVGWLPDFRTMLRYAASREIGLFLWEEARDISLRTALKSRHGFHSAAIVSGPEGGFSREEVELAEKAGLVSVTLGKRILRCETAPLCVLSALMYETRALE